MQTNIEGVKIKIPSLFLLLLSGILIIWNISFITMIQPLALRFFMLFITFFFLGLFHIRAGLLLWIFTLPLLPIYPLLNKVTNFSPSIIFLSAMFSGNLLKNFIEGKQGSISTNKKHLYEKLLSLYFIVIIISFILVLMQNHVIFSTVFFFSIPSIATGIFQGIIPHDTKAYKITLDFILGFAFFFWIKPILTDRRFLLQCLSALISGAAVSAIYGYIQFLFGFNLIDFWEQQSSLRRINATFPDVNSAGSFFAAMIFIALGFLWSEINMHKIKHSRYYKKEIYLFLAAFFLIILLMTGSKTNLILFFLLLPFFIFLSSDSYGKIFRFIFMRRVFFIVLLIILISAPVIYLSRLDKFKSAALPFLNSENHVNEIMKGRTNLWRSGLMLWSDAPLFGNGYGCTIQKLIKYYNSNAPYWNPPFENIHNYFIQIGAETGLIGIFLFIILNAVLVFAAARFLSEKKDSEYYHHVKSSLFAVLIFLGAGFFSHPLLVCELLWMYILLAALIISFFDDNASTQGNEITDNAGRKILLTPLFGILLLLILSFPIRVFLNMDNRIFTCDVIGTYDWEFDETGRPYKWCRDKVNFLINNNESDIAFHLQNPRGDSFPIRVEIFLDGKFKEDIILNDYYWTPFRVYYPAQNRFRTILLRADKYWTPKEILNPENSPDKNQDTRRLAFKISYMNFLDK